MHAPTTGLSRGLGRGPAVMGRYWLFDEIGRGGTATVHLGRLVPSRGFSRVVAIKRPLPALAEEPGRVQVLVREARLSARIAHPNVVQMLDVVEHGGSAAIVMAFVAGVSLAVLLREANAAGRRVPPRVVAAILYDALRGLHAAHEAQSEDGVPLGIVHRDVSPQNLLVGRDGTTLVLDFGIAKALLAGDRTATGVVKGKLAYMSREQLLGQPVTRQTDVYAAGVVLWEALSGRALYSSPGEEPGRVVTRILAEPPPPLRAVAPELGEAAERVVARALSPLARDRFATAEEMALALEEAIPRAPPTEVAEEIERLAGDELVRQAELVRAVERYAELRTASGAAHEPASRWTRWSPWSWWSAALLLGVLAGVLVVASHAVSASTPPAPSRSEAAGPPPPSSVSTSTAAVVAPFPPQSVVSSGPPVPVDVAAVAPHLRMAPAPAPPPRPRRRPPSAASTSNCDTPYSVDANGQKHYKEACLR